MKKLLLFLLLTSCTTVNITYYCPPDEETYEAIMKYFETTKEGVWIPDTLDRDSIVWEKFPIWNKDSIYIKSKIHDTIWFIGDSIAP